MTVHARPRLGLGALAITQIVAWGVLYYAILVAAPAIATETGWSEDGIFLAITAGLLTSAVCAVPVGRWLDVRPRRVMLAGAIVGTVAMLGAASSPTLWVFAAAWVVCGAAQSATLYQAAFTVITHRHREARRGPLTLLTLAGGLASTIFAPITGWLLTEIGWRATFVTLAITLALVTIPAVAYTVEGRWQHAATPTESNGVAKAALGTNRFWMLTLALAMLTFSLYTVTLSAVPAATEKGLDLQLAAWVLGLIGAGQVLGRLLYLAIPHRAAPWIAPSLVGLFGAASLVGFSLVTTPAWVIATGIFAGAVRGALTLVQASAVADRWGTAAYGRLNGVLAAPISALGALAPGVAATLATALGSYQAMGLVMAALCVAGGILVIRR